jgi:hypothetical protein
MLKILLRKLHELIYIENFIVKSIGSPEPRGFLRFVFLYDHRYQLVTYLRNTHGCVHWFQISKD